MMPRFKLDPNKTAMENVFDCASMATTVIMRSHAWYHLYGELRDELFDEVRDATVAHFITYKVMKHGYRRFAKDGTPLNFASNMISSCYGVCGHIADRFLKRLTRITKTEDIESVQFSVSTKEGMPRYLSKEESYHRKKDRKDFDKMRVADQARIVKELYEDYVLECEEMGIGSTGLGQWMTRNGYTGDELFIAVGPRDMRMQWQSMKKYKEKKRKKAEEKAEASLGLESIYGRAPQGYEFCMQGGILCIRRKKEEQ